MSRKPGKMYRSLKGMVTTRREYMGGVPAPRITQFDIGNKTADFPIRLSLIALEPCQIRHNSLEAARLAANRLLEKKVGLSNYRLMVRVYPHNVIRENKQATGAGADRVSQGMRASYGKPVGTAARVKANQILMTVDTVKDYYDYAKDALRKATTKVSTPCRIDISKGADLLK